MITGIHHVTAMSGDAQTNIDFYVGILGLRLVKITVNYDDPGMYHFYYGDGLGRPGTILTFFPMPGARPGRIGTGQTIAIALSIPPGSADYWRTRLTAQEVKFDDFGATLSLNDPDGLPLILTEVEADDRPGDNASNSIPTEFAIRGIDSVTLQVAAAYPTLELLTDRMGFAADDSGDGRFTIGSAPSGASVYLHEAEENDPPGLAGPGTIHHIAFRVPDDTEQNHWHEELTALGYHVSPIRDRQYFHSIYFREPGGILFELATDGPGFTADGEDPATLGTTLRLPPWLEKDRERIAANLPKLKTAGTTP